MSTDPHTVPTTPQPYAICLDCGDRFADRDAMTEHTRTTMTPTGAASGTTAKSHTVQVKNPTPDEVAASRLRHLVSSSIDDAIESAFDSIDRRIQRGDATEQDVTDEISRAYPDLSEAWADWLAGDL